MKQKNLLLGVVTSALTLGMGTAAYAAGPNMPDLLSVQVTDEVATMSKSVKAIDSTNLTSGTQDITAGEIEGVEFRQDISIEVIDGEISFDEVNQVYSITTGNDESTDTSAEAIEGSLSFEAAKIDGVQILDNFTITVADGDISNE